LIGRKSGYDSAKLKHIPQTSVFANNLSALVALGVVSALVVMGGACPGYPRRQRFKDGADMGRGPRQSFAGSKLSTLPRSRAFDAPNDVDRRDKPGHEALKVVRRSPHNPDSHDNR
jgi:hypothetical protein